jgi:hypothetical protein
MRPVPCYTACMILDPTDTHGFVLVRDLDRPGWLDRFLAEYRLDATDLAEVESFQEQLALDSEILDAKDAVNE